MLFRSVCALTGEVALHFSAAKAVPCAAQERCWGCLLAPQQLPGLLGPADNRFCQAESQGSTASSCLDKDAAAAQSDEAPDLDEIVEQTVGVHASQNQDDGQVSFR